MKIMAHKPGLKPSLRYANKFDRMVDYCFMGYVGGLLLMGSVIVGDCILSCVNKRDEERQERPGQAVVEYNSGLESRVEK